MRRLIGKIMLAAALVAMGHIPLGVKSVEASFPSEWTFGLHPGGAWAVAYSPWGEVLASGGVDNMVKIWSADSSLNIKTLRGHKGAITALAFSPDGQTLVSVGLDNSIKVWRTSGWTQMGSRRVGVAINDLAFSPDARYLAGAGNDNLIRIWKMTAGKLKLVKTLVGHTDRVFSSEFSPNGLFLASGGADDALFVWSLERGPERAKLLVKLRGHTDDVMAIGFFPDGVLASTSLDRTVRLWSIEDREQIGLGLIPADIPLPGFKSLAASADEQWIGTGSDDSNPLAWWRRSGREISFFGLCEANGDDTVSLAFSPDSGKLASGSVDGTVKVIPTGTLD